ncbi:hypothetical protein ALC56_09171 [Trachymyrmex septentrionalis]|uniref:Uncharacterized protein n=1 Tax=Trachymyrmex septentrionalis TaxID=34720 RepID=A0A195F749_9HYME|nr:hypothetical protein ALC56_09171 [Trachymyrmex septentrionalis]
MSVLNFAQEFSRLINRYTRTASPHNDAITPLTEEQIVSTIHHVLLVLIKKDFDKNNPLQICDSASAATTLESSVVQMKQEPKVEDVRRFQDVRSVTTDEESSSFSDISLKDIKKERENSFNTLQKDKKFISQSNPSIYVSSNISRSDTFVREEHSKEINNEVFKDFTDAERIGETDSSSDFYQVSLNEIQKSDISSDLFHISLNEIRKSVMNIMAKLNHLEHSFLQLTKSPKEVTPRTKKSSLINSYSNSSGISVKTRTSANNHKPSTTSPKTPNSSKQHAMKDSIFERRKSVGAIANVTPVKKSNESTKVCHSVSNVDLSPYKPVGSSDYRPKFTKNPKYAHVRSTIPKAISQKKKL